MNYVPKSSMPLHEDMTDKVCTNYHERSCCELFATMLARHVLHTCNSKSVHPSSSQRDFHIETTALPPSYTFHNVSLVGFFDNHRRSERFHQGLGPSESKRHKPKSLGGSWLRSQSTSNTPVTLFLNRKMTREKSLHNNKDFIVPTHYCHGNMPNICHANLQKKWKSCPFKAQEPRKTSLSVHCTGKPMSKSMLCSQAMSRTLRWACQRSYKSFNMQHRASQ